MLWGFSFGLFLFIDKISLKLGLEVTFMFLQKVLILLFFFLGGMEELAIFALATEASLSPELARLFGLLLVHKWTVGFNALAPSVVSAYLSPVLALHELGGKS